MGSSRMHLAAVDVELLRFERFRDVLSCYRAEEMIVFTDAVPESQRRSGSSLARSSASVLRLSFAAQVGFAFLLDDFPVGFGGGNRQSLRKQIIARVAVGDFHYRAAASPLSRHLL